MAKIDFKKVADQALNSLTSLLSSWLPDGKRDGHEFKALNPTRGDSKVGSFSINLNTGAWADFATGDCGGDAISLYAYITGESQLDAAKEIMQQLGMKVDDSPKTYASNKESSPISSAPAGEVTKKARSEWSPIIPVPNNAAIVPVAHIKRGRPDQSWTYRTADGALVGYIWRFTTSDGGKEILPLTYCQHEVTGAQEWRWMSFPDPRPLYVPGEWRDGVTKLIVEGEKCADVAHDLLRDHYDSVTWPGGGKAIDKADWSRFIEGDKVLLWPDCDAQREKLSPEEKAAGVDPLSKSILLESRQPGIGTMEKIAQKLISKGCKVRIVTIPPPGAKPSGWDIADAVDEGSTTLGVLEFLKANQRSPGALVGNEKSIFTATQATAEGWDDKLFWKNGAIRECRENVFQILMHHPDWAGCLAMDEFSNSIRLRRDTPIGLGMGEMWDEDQDFKLGLWLAKQSNPLFIKSDSMISSGVRAAAVENKFHPVREWLNTLVWDGVPRLGSWLSDYAGVVKAEYVSLVGRLFLIGMVARIYRPGCKMDTALILEGLQGEGKSTIARALAGEWFSDTTFVMGDKDSFMALRGKWAYELAELDSFNRSESTRAKAFISSSVDSYRAPYDRVSKDWPRQCVFIGTTNQYEYFKDASGNRRYWPVLCSGALNPTVLRVMRQQLFAEAVTLFNEGERWYPTKDEQDRLFTPEQEAREISDPWETAIYQWMKTFTGDEVTSLDILCGALKMEISKIDGAKQAAMRVSVCMRKLGWTRKRRSGGAREWVYVRPKATAKDSDDYYSF